MDLLNKFQNNRTKVFILKHEKVNLVQNIRKYLSISLKKKEKKEKESNEIQYPQRINTDRNVS